MNAQQIVLTSRPKTTPTEDDFRFGNIELPELKENELLLECLYY